jgi:hypothetical protein
MSNSAIALSYSRSLSSTFSRDHSKIGAITRTLAQMSFGAHIHLPPTNGANG